jgi:hypothetical protein
MATIKIAAKLPDGVANGLTDVYRRLCKDPDGLVACYVLLDVKSLTEDRDTEETNPTVRIRHIEAADGGPEARDIARRLVDRRERRLNRTMLPLDLGDELTTLLGIDPDTGEITRLGDES